MKKYELSEIKLFDKLQTTFLNDLNNMIITNNLNREEVKLIFSMLSLAKDKNELSTITYEFIRKELGISPKRSNEYISNQLQEMYLKLDEATMMYDKDTKGFIAFKLFPYFKSIPDENGGYVEYLTLDMVRDLLITPKDEERKQKIKSGNYTSFYNIEHNKLSTKISSDLWRRLMQYKTLGKYYVNFEDLKQLLDLTSQPNERARKRIDNAVKEINQKELSLYNVNVMYHKKGRSIAHLTFTFDYKEMTRKEQIEMNKDEMEFIYDSLMKLFKDEHLVRDVILGGFNNSWEVEVLRLDMLDSTGFENVKRARQKYQMLKDEEMVLKRKPVNKDKLEKKVKEVKESMNEEDIEFRKKTEWLAEKLERETFPERFENDPSFDFNKY